MKLEELDCNICGCRFWMTRDEIAKFVGGNPTYSECPRGNCIGDIRFSSSKAITIPDEEAQDG
jgi:hypothetical protein